MTPKSSEIPNTDFDSWYKEVPPWDIGRPQKDFVVLEREKKLQGSILDVGCGTGENALFLAEKGYEVTGVDFSPRAIEKAREKARTRHFSVYFEVKNALKLTELKRQFDCVIDSGLFHCFSDEDRATFVNQIYLSLKSAGHYYLLCFSEKETREGGPRRISVDDIKNTFSKGWKILSIKETIFENTLHVGGSQAYLVSLQKIGLSS